MTIKGISDRDLQYFISAGLKLDQYQYDSQFDIDYRNVETRYSRAQELIKENPELFDGILTAILNIFIYVSREAKWAKDLLNNYIAGLAKNILASQPAEETDDEDEVSEQDSSYLSGRVSPNSDAEPFTFQAPPMHFGGPPYPDLPHQVETDSQTVRVVDKGPVRRAPPFRNLPDTIFPNFPSGREEIMAN